MALRLPSLTRLVRTLVPRAQLVAVFDRKARISWATDTAEHEDLRLLAAELLASAGSGGHTYAMRCELDSAASYAFLVRDPSGVATGVLALTVAGPFRRTDLLRPAALQARLAPLLAEAARAAPASIERELALLADRTEAEAVIASVPGQNLVRAHRKDGTQLPDSRTLQGLVGGERVARAGEAAEPLRIDKARVAPDAPVFGFISVPLRRGAQVVGVLAVFASQARRPFSAQDAERVAASAARLAELLEP